MLARLGSEVRSFFSPPGTLPADAFTHWMYLVIAVTLVAAPFLLTSGEGPLAPVRAGSIQLPAVCPSRALAGVECPGCGATHAFVEISQGHWRESFRWHRLGLALYAYFLFQVPFRAWLLRRPELRGSSRLALLQHWLAMSLIILLIGNWLLAFWLSGNGS